MFIPIVGLLLQLALIAGILVFIFWYTIFAISANWNAPYVPTPRVYLPKIFDALDIKEHDIVYDLGSGDGRLILYCAIREPRATYIGIERNWLLVMYARLYSRVRGNPQNVSFRRKDLFKADFSDATRIYSYLLTKTLNNLFANNPKAPRHVRLVSRAFLLRDRTETSVVQLTESVGGHGEHLLHIYAL